MNKETKFLVERYGAKAVAEAREIGLQSIRDCDYHYTPLSEVNKRTSENHTVCIKERAGKKMKITLNGMTVIETTRDRGAKRR